ncbi:Nif3-like dinuclear metal center hexameric protein [Lacrimispora sp. NSJ-141]|uniref:GTP cyclohydrolase 1 type 2 homolog n=1 Tax=Lientehia hominis TaxID=2897778 RepID=A0AAP2RH60_9FIRM|nr:Nif3-like dinuclear metal center hexameric protein [Lientehia hominis]MCD2491329.1 Nif3-like dinuclear metal center hexameric protein [Lientehia hominis]
MKKCREIKAWFDKKWPESLACDWDNVGLLAGRADKEVRCVYVALDATDEVIEAAVQEKADMLITHHPLIFGAIKKVSDEASVGRRVLKLLQADISYYAGHTNFDIAEGGMADLAAECLGLRGCLPLEAMGEHEGVPVGIGKTGSLAEAMTVVELSQFVKERFCIPAVTVYSEDKKRLVRRIAVSPGSGKSMQIPAVEAAAEVLITGDMGHHEGLDLMADGLSLIDAGHYGLEHIFVDAVAKELEMAGFGLVIKKAPVSYPYEII